MTAPMRDPQPGLEAAMAKLWADSANPADPRPWDAASAEVEAPEVAHPRYDDPDMAADWHYRNEVA